MQEGPRNMWEKTGAGTFSVLSSASESLRRLKGHHDNVIYKHEQRRGQIPPERRDVFNPACKPSPCVYNFLPPSFDHIQPTVIFLFLVHALDIREISLYLYNLQ